MDSTAWIALAIFMVVYVFIVSEKIHRTVIALTGAMLMIVCGILTQEMAIHHIDFNTIGLLAGMMVVVNITGETGLFNYLAVWSAKKVKAEPLKLLVALSFLTAICSAFLDNVTTVLLTVPLTFSITRQLNVPVKPFLVAQILASNIGGTSTLIGDPPNIMIGSAAGLSFVDFLTHLGPVVIVILAVTIICFKFIYGNKLVVDEAAKETIMNLDEKKSIQDRALLKKSIVMIIFTLVGFVFHSNLGIESCVVAITSAVIMLLIGKQDVDEIFASIEWSTIFFFVGLFIVVGGLVESGVIGSLAELIINATEGHIVATTMIILWLSAIISAFLDNIPFVATLIPLILTMQANGIDVTPLWWATSLGACLGGNGSLIGASANVVLAGVSEKHGHPITFGYFLKIGFPLMILSVIISTAYLLIVF